MIRRSIRMLIAEGSFDIQLLAQRGLLDRFRGLSMGDCPDVDE